jgi:hypothetical protein
MQSAHSVHARPVNSAECVRCIGTVCRSKYEDVCVIPHKGLRTLLLKWVGLPAKQGQAAAELTVDEAVETETLIHKHCPELTGLLRLAEQ